MRGLDKFCLISGALVIVTSLTVRYLLPDEDAQDIASLKSVFPQAERFSPHKVPFPHHQAIARDWQTGDTRLLGYCFDTAEIVPRVRGFGGPMHILAGMDLSGRLVGLEILDHNETPAYVAGLEEPWFLDQFVGKGGGDPLEMGQDLDALSGATITSRAVSRAVREGLASVSSVLLDAPRADREREGLKGRWWWQMGLLVALMSICLAAFFLRKGRWRPVTLLLGFVLVGFYLNGSLSVVHLVNVLSLRFPPFPEHIIWYLILLFGVITALFIGRIYCGWMCPFGALQEFLKKIVPLRLRPSAGLHRWASRLRKLLLWFILCLVIISRNQDLLQYEPFALAFGSRGTTLMWTSLILILGASLFIERFWCRYLCVVGMALHLLGKLGLRRKRGIGSRNIQLTGDF